MLCGFGFYPWFVLSTSDHTHEVYHESSNDGRSQGNRAMAILKERYVKGEVTKEQFLEMRRTLES